MGTLLLVVQLLATVLTAVARAAVRRFRHGPLVPGWSWEVEMKPVAMRAFIMGAAAHPDPRARAKLEARWDPPLPRQLRAVLRRRDDRVGDVPGEWLERTGPGLEDSCTLLYFHGGAYLAGSPATHREWTSRLTWAIGSRTFVPDYRLAPGHRFPAALDDAVAVYEGLLASGVSPEHIVVAGDSAGGGLATAMLLRLRDEGRPLPLGAVLFSPYTDLAHTSESITTNRATDYLPFGGVRPNTEYLGDHDPKDPYASPVHGDFTGIPEMLVFAGGREMILDDSMRMVDRARLFGCDASLHVSQDMFHVWPAVLPRHPETRIAEARTADWIRRLASSQ